MSERKAIDDGSGNVTVANGQVKWIQAHWSEATFTDEIDRFISKEVLEEDRKEHRFLLTSCKDVYKCFVCRHSTTGELWMVILCWWLPETKSVCISCFAYCSAS